MQELKISIKARKSWRNLIKRVDGISGFRKCFTENARQTHLKSGRECGEALDPVLKRNLHYRLESGIVLAKDNSSLLSGDCHARELVITRTPTRLASTSTPSSSPVLSPNHLKFISPKLRSCSLSGYCSDESSISFQGDLFTDRDVGDHPVLEPPFDLQLLHDGPIVAQNSSTSLTITMEEAEEDIHAINDESMEHLSSYDVKDDAIHETIQNQKEKLANVEKLLEVANAEIRRLKASNDSFQAKELELLERQVVAQEAMSTLSINKSQKESDSKRKDALVEAKAKASSIIYYVEELDKNINETRDWENASDMKVKRAMRNTDEWRSEMKKIITTKMELMILVEKNNFTDDEVVQKDRVEREVRDLKAAMDAAIISIQNEDNVRALYSLDTTPVIDPVKLPEFSGKDGEDFHLFKEEVERGFVRNRIPRADQLLKLRECLSGAALAFVPKSTVTTIDEAWAVLKKSYGDAYRIIKYRKEELMKVGKFPKVNTRDRGGYSQQIVWFIKVENILKGILDLGKNHPEYSDSAFSFELISTVVMMFPQRLRIKLYKCPGKKGEQLKNILLKIENLREIAQGLQLFMDASTPYLAVAREAAPGLGTQQQGESLEGGGHNVVWVPNTNNRARRNDKSRICNTLGTKKLKSGPSILKAIEGEKKDKASKPVPVNKSISTKEATRKLKKKFRAAGDAVEVKPVPAGRTQFMMGQTKGKTRPLNILYDTGCYSLLLKEGVQHELGKSVLKTKGPFAVKGVGNTSVKVNDEWLTTLKLLDGTRQAVEGWTVDEVTAPLPIVDLSNAVKELKDDKPDDQKLQSMFVQLVAGGDCDILLGQLYNVIFPKAVHSLPNGLTIYELQIKPHDDQVNSVIGGPHESFEFMAGQVGGANFLFSQLLGILDNYKSFGPPSVTRTMMSREDEKIFQEQHKELEVEEQLEELFDEVCENENFLEQSEGSLGDVCLGRDTVDHTLDELASYNCCDTDIEAIENMEVTAEDDEVVETMFEGPFLENSEAIIHSLSKLTKAETKCEKVKRLFEGTFIENYEDVLDNLDKFTDENGQDDADYVEELVEGTEIGKNDSKYEGSRYEMEPVYDEETLKAKVDVHHKPFACRSSPRYYNTCCFSNPDEPHNDEPSADHDVEVKLCGLRGPMSKMLLHWVPIILKKFLAMIYSINMDMQEDQVASADNIMV